MVVAHYEAPIFICPFQDLLEMDESLPNVVNKLKGENVSPNNSLVHSETMK